MEEKEKGIKNQKNEKNKKVKTKKQHKKPVIISIIVILILIALIIGGYYIYQQIELNKPLETAWGDTYYAYLKEIQKEPAKLGFSLDGDIQDIKIQFYQIEENTDPIMKISYKDNNKNYINLCYIKDGKVTYKGHAWFMGIEYLYNIEQQKYGWYLHLKYGEDDKYIELKNINDIENSTSKEIIINKDDATTVETINGKTLSISKFDETFIKPEVNESVEIDLNITMTEKELKNAVEEAIDGYKTKDEIETEEVKNQITSKQEELNNKKQEIEEAKEETRKKEEQEAAKKAAEEAKKAKEEASKVIQAGKYTLKYGKYTGIDYAVTDDRNSKMEVTIILNSNGTYTKTDKTVSTGKYESISGTFKISSNSGFGDNMILTLSNGGMYIISGNNQFNIAAGSGATYKYQG